MDIKDSIRLEEFRQLKNEIRGSDNHLLVGPSLRGRPPLRRLFEAERWIAVCHQS